jgi:DNA-binding beta-propeller fold protein YncE
MRETPMRYPLLLCTAILALSLAVPATAEVEWNILKTIPLEGKPLDTVLSPDGKRMFVLLQGGKLQVYSSGGELQESLDLGAPADGIALSPKGDLLYVRSGEKKTVQVVRLEFVQQISTAGSPVRGPESAPVAIAIFNDFQ